MGDPEWATRVWFPPDTVETEADLGLPVSLTDRGHPVVRGTTQGPVSAN